MPIPVSLSRSAAALALAASLACRGAAPSAPDARRPARDALPRPLTAGEQTVVGAANEFSFSLFRRLSAAQKDSNVFVSPLSASMALGMTMNGAAGATYDQMRATLGFAAAAPEREIDDGYKGLIDLLRGLDSSVDFRIANSIWYRNGFTVEPSFLDAARNGFDARVSGLDFGDPAAVGTINGWASGATAGKIPTIVQAIDRSDVMYLINAIYFKGSWRDRFDPAETADAPFHGVAGDRPAKLMHRHGTIAHLRTPQFDAVDLPYGDSAFTMTVLLPTEGTSVDAVAASMRGTNWSTWTTQLQPTTIDLYLPRFRLAWERTLNDDLAALGMHDAFVPGGADFTRMSPQGRHLYVSVVKQKTYVDVDEEGTEAAAVTSVGMTLTSMPVSVVVRVDRPFLFVIRERLSGTVLFMGRMVTIP